MAPKPPANQYTAYFNAIINNAHRTPSSGGLPAVSTKTAPVANNSVASIIASGALNAPIAATAPAEKTGNPLAALDFGNTLGDLWGRAQAGLGGAVEQGTKDLHAVIKQKYAPETMTPEDHAALDMSAADKVNQIAGESWKGLSGQTHNDPGKIFQRESGLSGFAGFLAGFGIDILTDPMNAVNPLAAGTAAVNAVRGLKGLEKIEAPVLSLGRKTSTLAPVSTRANQVSPVVKAAVPDNFPDEIKAAIKKAKTPEEIKAANKLVEDQHAHDSLQNRFARTKETLPEVTAPVAPKVVPVSEAVQVGPETTIMGSFTARDTAARQLMADNPGLSYDDAFNQADNSLTHPVAPKVVPQTTGKMSDAFGFKAAPDTLLPSAKTAEEVATTVAETVVPKLKSKLAGAFDFKGLPDNLIPTAAKTADKAITKIEDVAQVTPASIPESVVTDITRGIDAAKKSATIEGGFGNASQAGQFIRFKNDVIKSIKAASPKNGQWMSSTARNNLITEQTLGKMKAAEEATASQGASHFVSSTQNGKKWALKGSDIIEALSSTVVNRHITGGVFQHTVHFAAVQRGAARALEIAPQNLKKTAAITEIARAMRTGGSSGNAMSLSSVANDLWHKTPQLLDRVTTNEARMGLKAGQDIPLMSNQVMDGITAALGSQAPKAIVDAIVDAPKVISKLGEQIGATSSSIAKATEDVAQKVAGVVSHADFITVHAVDRAVALRAAGKVKEARKVIAAAVKAVEKDAVEEAGVNIPAAAVKSADDLTPKFAIGQFATFSRLGKMTASRGSTEQAAKELYRSQGIAGYAGTQLGEFNKGLNAIAKKMTTAEILAEISLIKQGGRSANADLQNAVELVYGDHSLFGPLWRNGAGTDTINAVYKEAWKGGGKAPQFDDVIAKDAQSLSDQWKDWPIEDPLDHLSRAYHATRMLIAHQTVAFTMESNFGSLVKKPGYVKIVGTEGNFITPHLNPDMYFPVHAAKAIDYLEFSAGAPRNFAGSKSTWGKFINNIYDPILNTWKTYATVVRPANLIRNFFGEGILNFLHGMTSPKWSAAAASILVKKEGSKYVQTVRIGGQNITYSGDRALRAAKAHGLMPNFRKLEDIGEAGTSKIGKAITDNPLVRAGGRASEDITVHSKLSQFLYELSLPSNIAAAKDINHLEAIAAREVRKVHPDPSGLSPYEARVVKRIIPFYSWIRQAIPLVAEAYITRPGRVMALPKANYNLAVSNGVDPNSVSDQFPENGHYPSYLSDSILGPNDMFGKGTGFNFSSPVEAVFGDVLNSYGNSLTTGREGSTYVNNKFSGFAPAEMLSPFIKGPIELATGTRLTSGTPIQDRGEYIDQNIPLVSNLSSISGYSPTGTVTNALGFGPTKAPTLDPIRAVAQGERQHWLNMNLINFLTGAGLTQFNNPSSVRNARRESSALQAGQLR